MQWFGYICRKYNQELRNIKIFPLQYYSQSGDLKPPFWFYFSLLFLARAWALLLVSIASRGTGDNLLALFYPERPYFFLDLISGFIALLLFILSGREHDKHPLLSKLWQSGYPFLLLSITADFSLQLYSLSIHRFQYSLSASLQLVIIIWIFLYSRRSTHLKMSFIRQKFQ